MGQVDKGIVNETFATYKQSFSVKVKLKGGKTTKEEWSLFQFQYHFYIRFYHDVV